MQAVDDGIRGKDYLVVEDGDVHVDAGGDALKSDNDTAGELGWILVDGGQRDRLGRLPGRGRRRRGHRGRR